MNHQLDDIVTSLNVDYRSYGEALMLIHAKRQNMLVTLLDKGKYDIGELRELFFLLTGRNPNTDESTSAIRNAICRKIANPSTVFSPSGE